MSKVFYVYRKINRLSIDVALGAAVCSLFFARMFNIHLRPLPTAILFTCVWSIYAADHLMDAKNIKFQQLTERRLFYLSNFKSIHIAFGIALTLAASMSFFLYLKVIFGGLILSTLVLIYFILKDKVFGIKEVFCAALYSGGVLLAPLLNMNGSINAAGVLIISQFVLTVLLNLILFSLLDYENDVAEGQISFARHYGKDNTKRFIVFILSVQCVLIAFSFLWFHHNIYGVLVIFLMNAVLAFIFLFREPFQKSDRFREIGDSIFLLPSLYLLMD